MTTEEHTLMIGILASQLEAIHSLADLLKSRGIVDEGDLHAFWSIRPREVRKETVEKAQQIYFHVAKAAGIYLEELDNPPVQ
jgi:hypothetical protein